MLKLRNQDTGEIVTFEPDENGTIHFPAGNWEVIETAVIPDGVTIKFTQRVVS